MTRTTRGTVPRQAPAPAAEPSAPLAFQRVFRVPAGTGIIPEVRRITAQWLSDKFRQPAPLETGTHFLRDHVVLTTQASYHSDGAEHGLRIQLREDNPEATWRVTVTAVAPVAAEQAVCVTLECFDNGITTLRPARPALVEKLVEALRPRDGLAHLTLHAQSVTTDRVDTLVDILCDPDRRLPVVLAARPLQPDPVWTQRLQKIMSKCAGDASLYLLDDVDAVNAFRQVIGEPHRVAPGAVCTFLPEVDPAWPADGPRHRLLTGARISAPKDPAFMLVARQVQRHAREAELPGPLPTVSFPDEQQRKQEERRAAQDAAHAHAQAVPAHALEKEVRALQEENGVLVQLLSEGDRDLSEARRREALAERTVQHLRQELQQLTESYHRELEDHLLTLEDVERAQNEARVLRQRLHAQGRHADTVVLEQAAAQPATFEELTQRLGEVKCVLFTADTAIVMSLDDHELARTWAAKAWQGLRSLDSYAQAQKEGLVNGGYFEFCETVPVPGARIFPVKQIAMGETEATRSAWGGERTFPTPTELEPSGRMPMYAHLKLGSKGTISPRIYFYDDSRGVTGKVVVGYLGPRLTNRRT
ncbi:hypothetical protein GCM10022244_05350 [Streptomyces gulbargensis]|uniref:Uncharacterized protein n=1 Tax=Streptomyces gulbargensis TaxID=364901 RepID=A0ABP7LAA5_9ACTN